MRSNGFRQFITQTHSKSKISTVSVYQALNPTCWHQTGRARCSSNVSCCCQGATSKLNPSSFTDLQRHLKGTRYKVETPALSWTRRWMRNGLMTVSHRYVRRNHLVTAPHQAAYLPLLREEPQGISPRLESDCGEALPTWPEWRRARWAGCCTEKLFHNMLILCAFTTVIFNAKNSEALTKKWYWAFQLGPELTERKSWRRTVRVKFLTEYLLSPTHTG